MATHPPRLPAAGAPETTGVRRRLRGNAVAVPTIERSIDIDRPAADVWAVLEDVRRLPELSPSTVEVTAPPRLDAAGQTFRQVVELAGRRFESTWRVAGIVPGRCLAVEGSVLPGTRYRINEEVTPTGPASCRVTLRMTYKLPFGPLGRLAGKLGVESKATAEAEQLLAGLRRVADTTPFSSRERAVS